MNLLGELRMPKEKQALSEFLPSKKLSGLLEAAIAGKLPEIGLKVGHFQFIVVHVDEVNPDEVPKIIANVIDTFGRHEAMVSCIESSVVVGYYGLPNPENDSAEARQGLVAALLRENDNRVRVAHGQCNGLVGLYGGTRRLTYGAIIPNFSAVLKKLVDIKFGTAVEIA